MRLASLRVCVALPEALAHHQEAPRRAEQMGARQAERVWAERVRRPLDDAPARG